MPVHFSDVAPDPIKRNLSSAFQSLNDALRGIPESDIPHFADEVGKLCEVATLATMCAERLIDGDSSRLGATLTSISDFVTQLQANK